MAEIDHDTQFFHLLDDLFAKFADTVIRVVAFGRVADIIITVVAERHIDDTSLSEMLQVVQIAIKGNAILNAKHDELLAVVLLKYQQCGIFDDSHIILMLTDNLLYLVEDTVGIFGRILGRLRQVCHHDSGILATVSHLMQIDENTVVTLTEINPLREEHRSITVGVKGQHGFM